VTKHGRNFDEIAGVRANSQRSGLEAQLEAWRKAWCKWEPMWRAYVTQKEKARNAD
jgi:hypothetical protein